MRLDRLRESQGSVLLWAIACLAAGAMAAVTAAGVASLVGTQRQLADAADTAALAAANQVAVSAFRVSGAYGDLGINLSAATSAAQAALTAGGFDAQVTAVVETAAGVKVSVHTSWLPPLGLPAAPLRAEREVAMVIGD